MKTIIIDKNYNRIKKVNAWYEIDTDISLLEANVKITIPLVFKKSFIVGGSLEASSWLVVGGSLKVGSWLEVDKSLEIGEELEVFGEKTKKYAYIIIDKYPIIITSNYIQIGCELHNVEEWRNFSDRKIASMDKGALEWWKKWKNFVLSTHENLVEIYGEPTKGETK